MVTVSHQHNEQTVGSNGVPLNINVGNVPGGVGVLWVISIRFDNTAAPLDPTGTLFVSDDAGNTYGGDIIAGAGNTLAVSEGGSGPFGQAWTVYVENPIPGSPVTISFLATQASLVNYDFSINMDVIQGLASLPVTNFESFNETQYHFGGQSAFTSGSVPVTINGSIILGMALDSRSADQLLSITDTLILISNNYNLAHAYEGLNIGPASSSWSSAAPVADAVSVAAITMPAVVIPPPPGSAGLLPLLGVG